MIKTTLLENKQYKYKQKYKTIITGCCLFSLVCMTIGIILIHVLPKSNDNCNTTVILTNNYEYYENTCNVNDNYMTCFTLKCIGITDNNDSCVYAVCTNIVYNDIDHDTKEQTCSQKCNQTITNMCYSNAICYTDSSQSETSMISFAFVITGCVIFVLSVFACCSINKIFW